MKVLIVGGTGLISTSITRQLLARGDDVTLYNRGKRSQEFAGQVKEIHGDRRDFAVFERQMRDAGTFDCVIDMICYRPDEAESDVRALSGRCSQFIFCSTVDVYPRPSYHLPYREGETLDAPSEYGKNKIQCERIFDAAHTRGSMVVTTMRPAHTYCDSGAIIHSMGWSSLLLDRMRKGKPIIIHGDGQSLWVSCHADDVARGFVNAMGHTKAYGRAYHLPGEEWVSWNQYHRIVADVLGVKLPEIIHIPTDLLVTLAPKRAGVCGPNFQHSNIFDTSAARQDLDFRYTIPMRHGFARVVSYLDAHNAVADSDRDPFYDRVVNAWREFSSTLASNIGPEPQ